MVSLKTLTQAAWGGFSRWGNIFTSYESPDAGMYTYTIRPEGGQIRLHLRVDPEGTGVLFRDVTDVVHLNATAVEMAKLALDGVPQVAALTHLRRQYQSDSYEQIANELEEIYTLVETWSDPEGCPTCALGDLSRTALFSTPVNAPFKADLALTYGCNNECPHCYNEPSRYPMASLPKERWFEVIDTLNRVGVPHIILTGGEATLHPDLPEIIRYADQLGHIVGMNTNGRRIAHRPYMDTLAEAGLNHVQITLGSCHPAVHDAMMGARSFTQTVQGIRNALESGVHTITNTTLMSANKEHAEDIVDYLYDLGIRTFAMNGMIYSGGGFANPVAIPEEEMPALLIRVRDRAAELGMRFLWYTPTEYCRMSPVELEIGAKRCNAGEYSLCIEPNGDVLPCQSYYVAAGNILHDPWENIWHSQLFHSFRDREENPRMAGLPEKCWECPDLPLCGGGCRIEHEARKGNRIGDTSISYGFGGCSGSCRTSEQVHAPTVISLDQIGFVPAPGMVRNDTRGGGQMPGFIPLASVGEYPLEGK